MKAKGGIGQSKSTPCGFREGMSTVNVIEAMLQSNGTRIDIACIGNLAHNTSDPSPAQHKQQESVDQHQCQPQVHEDGRLAAQLQVAGSEIAALNDSKERLEKDLYASRKASEKLEHEQHEVSSRLQEVEARLQVATGEIEELTESKARLERELRAANQENTSQNKELVQIRYEVEELPERNAKLEKEMVQKQEELKTLKENNARLQENLAATNDEILKQQEAMLDSQATLDDLKARSKEAAVAKMAALRNKMDKMDTAERHQEKQHAIELAQNQVELLEAKKLREVVEKKMEEVQEEYRGALERLGSMERELEQTKQAFGTASEETSAKLEEQNGKMEQMKGETIRLQDQLAAANKEVMQGQETILELGSQLDHLQLELSTAVKDLGEAKAVLQEKHDVETRLKSAKAEAAEAQGRVGHMESEISRLQEQLAVANKDMLQGQEAVLELNFTNAEAATKLQEASLELKAAIEENAVLRDQLASMKEKGKQLQEQLTATQMQVLGVNTSGSN